MKIAQRFCNCVRSKSALALLVACTLAFGFTIWDATSASAAWEVTGMAAGEADDDEALVIQWTDRETDVSYLEVIYKDGSVEYYVLINPNPDSGTTSPGDEEMMLHLAKQAGGLGYLQPGFWKTPLGQHLSNQGIGPHHYHNPGYDDDEGGMSPSSSKFYDPADDALVVGGRGSIGGFGFDGSGGPLKEQLQNIGRKKGTNNGDDDGDQEPPQGTPFYDDFMVGPPELINPNPARGF